MLRSLLVTTALLVAACGSSTSDTAATTPTGSAGSMQGAAGSMQGAAGSMQGAGSGGVGGGTAGTAGASGQGGTSAAAGSGGSAGAAGMGGGTPATLDGRILFRGLGEGIEYDVEMYAVAVPSPVEIVRGDGHCDVHAPGEGDGFITFGMPGTLDLGPSVKATSGTESYTVAVDTSTGGFQYLFTKAGVDAFDKTWTLTNEGSASGLAATTLATLHVPSQVVPIVPAAGGGTIDTKNGPVTLQWTGGVGAQTFHIALMSSKADIDCYPSPSATSFELSNEILKLLDAQATPLLWAETVTYVAVGSRNVRVRVTSDNLD